MAAKTSFMLATLLGLGAHPVSAQAPGAPAPAARSVLDSVFTEEQAGRGEATFGAICSACHVSSQFGADFVRRWAGRTVHDLVEEIRATMPFDSPGSLSRQLYTDLIAYLLRLNGLPAGRAPLAPDSTLRQIRIVAPPAPGGGPKNR